MCLSTVSYSLHVEQFSIQTNDELVDGVVYCAKYAGTVFKKQGFGNLIITSSISAHIVNVPVDQPVRIAVRQYFRIAADYAVDIQRNKSSNFTPRQESGAGVARIRSVRRSTLSAVSRSNLTISSAASMLSVPGSSIPS